ncbi:condensation domain-containing protein [Streptomyces sp. NPDC049040]|uniref:condensation domain-containing protein n=1 Tax=Streptomyces sp. NPDC049040 TaxID=3365593 RepID=UPI003712D822
MTGNDMADDMADDDMTGNDIPTDAVRPPRILALSARSETALGPTAGALAAFLDDHRDLSLDDAATTLAHGRERFERRLAVLARDPAAAARALREPAGSLTHRRGTAPPGSARTVMVFTGQGSQYTGMAAGAYRAYPEFRDWLDQADAMLRDDLPAGLLECLFTPDLAEALDRTDMAAAAVVAVQLGLLRVLRRYGITPDIVLGHSVGEFSAAAAAGAVSDEDALRLVARRGVLMVERTRPGSMLAVRCSADAADGWDADAVAALVDRTPGVCVAVHNSPRDLVLSGESLAGLESRLTAAGLECRRLRTSHAFHSELLAPMADDFAAAADLVSWSAPTGPQWISCSHGPMTVAPDARYWRDHLTGPVRFWDALALACAGDGPAVLMEVGPHPVLLPLAARLPAPPALVPVLARDQDAAVAVAGAAAEAWCNGVPADLTGGVPGRRRHLPGYGFDRRVHSVRPEPAQPAAAAAVPSDAATLDPAGPARPPREVLAELWKDLLGAAPEPQSDFLQSGGDSLILLRFQQRMQPLLGTAPSLADLLDAGTFEAMAGLLPTPADVPPVAAGIPPAAVDAPPAAAVAEPAEPVTTYQVSAVQQGMLMIDLMQPDSNQHNVTLAFEVPGRVDESAMAAAFRDAQVRHSALRTVFTRDGGRFVPEIRPEPGATLEVVEAGDAGGGPLADASDVREWARKVSGPPVRCLATTTPVRGTLVRGPERSLLVFTAHHAVCDATSMGVMVDELAEDYRRHRAGLPALPAPAPVQYHHLLAAGTDDPAARAYWLDRLDGAQDMVPLPTDRPRPEVRDGSGAQWTWTLGPEQSAQARELAARLNTTLFSTMLAAYAALLRLRSGAGDLSIATPATGRTSERAGRVFGPLLNTLVLRVRITPGQAFDALARDVQTTVLDAMRYSDFPFDRLVAALNPRRAPGSTPLFSVMFTMPDQFALPDFDGQPGRPVELPGLGAKYDLTLYVTPADHGRLRLDLEYDPALFDESTVRGLAADYDALLAALAAAPDAAVPEPGAAGGDRSADQSGPDAGAESQEGVMTEMERYVARIWSETLGVDVTGAGADFFDAGGHSMLVLACLAEVQDRFPEATIQDFFTHRTVGAFAAHLDVLAGDGAAAGDQPPAVSEPETEKPRTAAVAGRATAPSGGSPAAGSDVLLTGAAGFLGAHLLATLLREPGGAVVCPIRPRDGDGGTARLEAAVARYAPDVLPLLRDRVTVVEADLRELTADALGGSIAGIGTVVHSAAESRMFGRIEDLRAANVVPTRLLADLALSRGWRMAHVSTATAVGAAPGDGPEVTIREEDFDRREEFDNPYSRSKFEAEQVIRRAVKDGLDATVHRVGGLIGDTRTGTFLPDPRGNLLYQLVRAIMRCGLVPDPPGFTVNVTPVDFAAAAVLRLSHDPSHSGRTFHVLNPEQLTMPALTGILRDLGYPAILTDPQSVASWLTREGADEADTEAAPFLRQFTGPAGTVVSYDTTATTAALAGLHCPAPDLALLRVVVGHCVDSGFFPKSRLWDFLSQSAARTTTS